MTVPKLNRLRMPELSGDALPRVALAGVALALAALLVGGLALFRVFAVAATKADKATATSRAAQTETFAVICAAVDRQRSGNPRRPPANTELGQYSGEGWQAVYVRLKCDQFTPGQLDAAIRSAAQATPTPGGSTPAPTPSTRHTPGG